MDEGTRLIVFAKPGDFGVGVGDWAAALVVGCEVTIDVTLEAALRE